MVTSAAARASGGRPPGPAVDRPARRHPRRRSWPTPGASTRTRPAASSSATAPPPTAAGRCASSRPATRPRRRYRYEIDSADLLRLTLATDDADEVFWAIVHSHVRSPARPSPTDIGLAFYPDALYILVSLADDEADPATGEPGVRAWRIVDGEARGGADG